MQWYGALWRGVSNQVAPPTHRCMSRAAVSAARANHAVVLDGPSTRCAGGRVSPCTYSRPLDVVRHRRSVRIPPRVAGIAFERFWLALVHPRTVFDVLDMVPDRTLTQRASAAISYQPIAARSAEYVQAWPNCSGGVFRTSRAVLLAADEAFGEALAVHGVFQFGHAVEGRRGPE